MTAHQEALQLPNVITYNAILAKALDWSKTLELLEEMEERQVEVRKLRTLRYGKVRALY